MPFTVTFSGLASWAYSKDGHSVHFLHPQQEL